MKELAPFLGMGLGLALAVAAIVFVRVRLGRMAEALGGELSWCGVKGRRDGRAFRYSSGTQHSRPRLAVLDVPVAHELVVAPRRCTRRLGGRIGLESEVIGLDPAFAETLAVFSADEAYARALFARPEARRATLALLGGRRDRLMLRGRKLALEIHKGLSCRPHDELAAGLDRLIELSPLVVEAARRAPAAQVTWCRKLRAVAPAVAIAGALLFAGTLLLVTWLLKDGG